METNIENNSTDSIPPKQSVAKVWLWFLPLVAVCSLAFCGLAGGLILWQVRSQQSEKNVPISSLPLQNQTEDNSPLRNQIGDNLPAPATIPIVTPINPTPPPTTESNQPATTFSCPDDNLSRSSTITAPLLSPISFATRQSSNGWPLDASLQFTTTVTKVLATFVYAGLENGLTWERVWYFGDKELSRGGGVWDAGPQGQLTVQVRAGEGGFAPGVYKLEIYLAGQLFSQGVFSMVKPDTPTQRPVQVAYTTWDGQTHQISVLDLTTNLTETLITSARGPAWSPDAGGLLFYNEADPAGLQVFNLGQKKAYPLNQEISFQTIAWSPNRTYLASTQAEGEESRLVLWNLNQNQAYPGPTGTDPAWSPEGQRLAYRRCDSSGWHISIIPVISSTFDTGRLQNLTSGDDSQPAWSWDGQRLAFVRREGNNQDIYVVNSDGSNLTRLTNNPTADVSPAWTPNGHLVFRSLREGQWGIYLMNADGTDQQQLLSTPAGADWQPDQLAVSTNIKVVEPAPPKPQVQIPAGHGLLAVSNQKNNDEMTFTIDNKENKIGPYQTRMLSLRPGHYTWTASWPGKNSRTGIADIVLGQITAPIVER